MICECHVEDTGGRVGVIQREHTPREHGEPQRAQEDHGQIQTPHLGRLGVQVVEEEAQRAVAAAQCGGDQRREPSCASGGVDTSTRSSSAVSDAQASPAVATAAAIRSYSIEMS